MNGWEVKGCGGGGAEVKGRAMRGGWGWLGKHVWRGGEGEVRWGSG